MINHTMHIFHSDHSNQVIDNKMDTTEVYHQVAYCLARGNFFVPTHSTTFLGRPIVAIIALVNSFAEDLISFYVFTENE